MIKRERKLGIKGKAAKWFGGKKSYGFNYILNAII